MLKRLDLAGFKSFADRTQFDFAAGLTAIVGPNGSGKCVIGDTLVALADGREVPIRELVEAALGAAAGVELLDDGVWTRDNPHAVHVVSLNPTTLRLEKRPVAAFVKREAPPSLVKIRTRAGREITATPYHPLFTLTGANLSALEAGALRVGTRVALPRGLPNSEGPAEFSPFGVLEHFAADDQLYVPFSEPLRAWARSARVEAGNGIQWTATADVPETHLRSLLDGQAIRAASLVKLSRAVQLSPPLDGNLKCPNSSALLRLPDLFTPDLARFLGLLVAEGRNTGSNQVWFVNSDPAINDEFARLARTLFGVEVHRKRYKECAEDCLIYSRTLGLVLERLFHFPVESCSAEKEVPPQLVEAGAETQWAFLSGLFEGDAYLSHRATSSRKSKLAYLEYVTASPKLARQVISLLLRLGVFAVLRPKENYASNTVAQHRRTYYGVFIYGTEQLRYVARHLHFVGEKAKKLASFRELPPASNPNQDLIPGVTALVREAAHAAGASVKRNRKDCPKLAAYVEQRREASRTGLLEVIRQIEEGGRAPDQATEHLRRLATLATSDIYWDEIVSIERVPPPDPWVYDLCLAETHNFVADNIIVHNSNIVDAVRWVLGEQSAKSLRGGEMADVIFNGSASRKSLGLAEVTMTFDNSRRALATDAEEVQIGRRVYRSGEGEYLINGQVCRLKDVKNLFLGSGAGNDAYSIIEQGRVDVLLQASTRDRRTIFEEAAGISRFKARKIETLRRLERVDQNVQRLKDIIDEVEKQLRSVKLQAAKAQRYQEYSTRLKDLRVALGLDEFRQLSERLQTEQAVLDGLRATLQEQTAQTETWEAEARQLEQTLQRLDEAVHEQEVALAAARQQIATGEGTLTHEWALSADLEADLARTRARLTELSRRVSTLAEAGERAAGELRGVEAQCEGQRSGVRLLEEELSAAVLRLSELQIQVKTDKEDHLEQMRQAARLQNDVVSFKAQVDNLRRERERLRQRTEQAAEHLASIDLELQELTGADESLQARLAASRQTQAGQRQERDRLRHLGETTTQLLADLRAQRSGLASRIEVLEGLERSHEGLGTGVREVFGLLEQPDPGPWRVVLGMIADFLTVRREYAPLIDLALGETAQRFLVSDAARLDEALLSRGQPFSGRVSFLTLAGDKPDDPAPADGVNGDNGVSPRPLVPARGGRRNRLIEVSPLGRVRMPQSATGVPAHPGILALAGDLAVCDRPDLAHLPAHLLGRTLLVRDLAAAREISAHTSGYRFVTLQGEVLETDGTLTVGTHHAETGILSRKSELRELREQAAALDQRIADAEADLNELRERTTRLDHQIESLQEEIDVLAEQAADLRSRISQHRQRREGLHEEVVLSRTEISGLEHEIEASEASWQQAREQAEAAENQVQALQARLQQAEREIVEREAQRQRQQQEYTAAKVELAQADERLAALRARHQQVQNDLDQRQQECAQAEQQQTAARARLDESQRTMLQTSAGLAHSYLAKEAAERQLGAMGGERDRTRQQRQVLVERTQVVRNTWRTQQEQAHARELEVNDLRHRRDTLVERLREDYQLDLAELYQQRLAQALPSPPQPPSPTGGEGGEGGVGQGADAPLLSSSPPPAVGEGPGVGGPPDPAAANEEIAELRRKLSRLGSVNLESLQELADLETRAASLQAQYDDLDSARRSLEEIIGKINADSRRLFTETFQTIRVHFQELFRKLFGGGMADIVLEDETDILECGIEIIARPPGKELRSISLMSGGEKTMTAVALLLAIFRSKPSPFCILDEVDAALDEANIGRFTGVLRDFLDRSQFIIITHSKRTMASADVLYGITMQESGISKRVAVRFEDWPDDEQTPPGA
jgi:chromosome segregation protein